MKILVPSMEDAESLNVLINRWGDLIKIKDGKMNGVKQPFKGV